MSRESVRRRRGLLLETLTEKRTMQISEIMRMMHVSDETLRKDLIALEEQGILRRHHGGVTLVGEGGDEQIDVRSHDQVPAKLRIANEALRHIPDDGAAAIGLDSGNTVWYLARLLSKRSGQTIITNSLDSSQAFAMGAGNNIVYCTGGILRDTDRAFYGQFALDCINSMALSVAVMGTGGAKNQEGIGAVSFDDRDIKQAMRRQSDFCIAVLDSTKFDKNVLLDALGWEDFDIVITDNGIRPQDRARVENKTKLIIV